MCVCVCVRMKYQSEEEQSGVMKWCMCFGIVGRMERVIKMIDFWRLLECDSILLVVVCFFSIIIFWSMCKRGTHTHTDRRNGKWRGLFMSSMPKLSLKLYVCVCFLIFHFFFDLSTTSFTHRCRIEKNHSHNHSIESNQFNVPEPIESFKWYWMANNIYRYIPCAFIPSIKQRSEDEKFWLETCHWM